MVLKYYMQHDVAAGLLNDEIQPGRESKLSAVLLKKAKLIISTFYPKLHVNFAEIL